jgi:ribosomal protein L7/L12
MAAVQIHGWRRGFEKVSHTEALREAAGLSLAEAKAITDAVLDGECRVVTVSAQSDADALVKRLTKIGAIAKVVQS